MPRSCFSGLVHFHVKLVSHLAVALLLDNVLHSALGLIHLSKLHFFELFAHALSHLVLYLVHLFGFSKLVKFDLNGHVGLLHRFDQGCIAFKHMGLSLVFALKACPFARESLLEAALEKYKLEFIEFL